MVKIIIVFFVCLCICGCATFRQHGDQTERFEFKTSDSTLHTLYLVGNTALAHTTNNSVLNQLTRSLQDAPKESTLLFLGNTVSSAQALQNIKSSLADFKGKSIFIPGELEWGENTEHLRDLEKQTDALFGKNSFLPEKDCPIKEVSISEQVVLLVIDSQWYLSDWDHYTKINDNCDIKDRESFFLEVENVVKDNLGKTILIATHHPMFSTGEYGGQYSFKESLKPIPVVGLVKNLIKKTGGIHTSALQNSLYRSFRRRITTLAQYSDKVIFLSGHEQSLQYIFDKNVHQIISGSGSGATAVRPHSKSRFGYGQEGYAKLEIFKNGSSRVSFIEAQTDEMVFQHRVLPADKPSPIDKYPSFPKVVRASIYDSTAATKGHVHRLLWGDRYRRYYGMQIAAPTVDLDTLFGGVRVVKKGGGHQSLSLRLENTEGKQYVMRALQKSAEAYLQYLIKEDFIIGKTEGLAPNRILKDFYTGDHPYAPFTIAKLADAAAVFHTNPVLYFVPKQPALEHYNESFGDQLYMIEEHAGKGHGDQKSFGYANSLISTADLIKKLAKDERHSVDTDAYIRARLFDMLIGDWDRHDDQWRWAEFEDEKSKAVVYKPVPRDRDQAFSIMGDGLIMGVATRAIPALKLMEGFRKEIRNVKGFNSSPRTFSLDSYLLPQTTLEQWVAQANYIQERITPEVIAEAFLDFPKEVQDETLNQIQSILLFRKANLEETARTYFGIISKRLVILGTNKDDHFVIEDEGDGITSVTGYRIKAGKDGAVFFQKKIDKKETKDVWIYGLDDDDYFEVRGGEDTGPRLKLIGGQNTDRYDIQNRNKVKIYDYKTQKNSFSGNSGIKRLTDVYSINTYDPFKAKNNINQIIPGIGANPDDGLKISLADTYTHYGFIQEPFTSQHKFNAAYYFATNGYEFSYAGAFARTLGKASLQLDLKYTTPNFAMNFFGFGNETPNFDERLDFDFNRVKIEIKSFAPSLVWNGRLGSKVSFGASYENLQIENNEGRFVEDFFNSNLDALRSNDFLGVDAKYSYENTTGGSFPTLGLSASLQSGYKTYLTKGSGKSGFAYLIPSLSIDYELHPSGVVVLASKLKSHINFGTDFEFYQGAQIGAEAGLRGYRFQRFTGKSSLYQSSDLRVSLKRFQTSVIPIVLGVYTGFDYGRVWVVDDTSKVWHTSYGGGIFINGLNLITARASLFTSADGARFNFGLGFSY
ncbi:MULTISPECIES: phosphoesterase [unclassified Leeuwenhoekiella]|uniref:phosphoesterase n=1 Tax=unclassified Leeuwenhoekiella TaxID=2615029 RepID=UPI000C66B733|nr:MULTISPECIES: phosphoesterase [unclassified Leeuwenhoekiella]MAW96940.1 phosphoesterase [Leeuwenhoekiella sp.]MBA80644.1 phosphoesterase [Leeuwenhoekiella sp.]|tara:strand:+ start:6058 stop:9684 length:3627 start_codon:yes stop_codon:yes gene_type:complete